MFRSKIFIPTIIFLIFLITTSLIKNQTRILEKKINKLNKKITLKEKDINESQLDFYFLTSPAEIDKKFKTLEQNNYSPIKNSKIFLSLSNYTNLQKRISVINNKDEKKTKN
jgi:cell division protein FtsL